MSLSLTWADAQDGTGGTATVAGSSGGTVYVYATAIDATTLPAASWTEEGNRSGNGTLTLDLEPGYWWLYASESGTLGVPVYAPVTTSADSVTDRCKRALQARFESLVMTGAPRLPNERVYRRMTPHPDALLEYPCIILSSEGVMEGMLGGTNARDDIGYPVVVWLADRNLGDPTTQDEVYSLWRQQLMRAVRSQRLLPGVPEVYNVVVEPNLIYDPKLPAYQFVVSAFVARCVSREVRGLT